MALDRVFVGRARELEQLAELLDGVAAGRGALALVAGEAGIGKTRLVSHMAATAEARGFRVVWGRCWEAGGAPAYFPWSQVFAALGAADPFAIGDAGAGDAREVRFRQYESAAASLAEVSSAAPLVIVLDDLHAADLPSLGFLQALARGITRARMLVVGTYREIEARLGDAGALLAKIGREGDVLALPRLSRDETLAWIRQAAPAASLAAAAAVCDATDGNPLFVNELLRVPNKLDVRRLPSGLAAVIGEQIARVADDVRDALAAASVLGRELSLGDVAALAELDADRVASLVEIACAAGIVEPLAGQPDAFAFTHALVRDHLYAQLAPSRRARLHWRAGEHVKDPALAAHHLLAGREAGDVRRAAEVTHEAARAALARLAFEEASRLAAQARALLDGPSELACRLELIQAQALITLGEADRGRALCLQITAAARALGSGELLARAALVYGTILLSSKIDPTMVQLLREGLAALAGSTDDDLRAQVMSRLGTALTPPTPETLEESVQLARDAAALALRTGNLRTQLRVAYNGLAAHYYRLPFDERDRAVDDTVALARAQHDDLVLLTIAPTRFMNLRERGRASEADAVLADLVERNRGVSNPQYAWRVEMLRATRALLAGELAVAEQLGNEALAAARSAGIAVAELAWTQHRISLAIASGDPSSIGSVADRVLAHYPTSLTVIPSWVYAATGRHDEARAALAHYTPHVAHVPATLLAADIARMLGDRELAERVRVVLDQLAGSVNMFWGGPPIGTAIGPLPRFAADLAALLGREDEARTLYDRAIAVAETIGAVPMVALARRGRDALGAARPASTTRAARVGLARSGDHWTLAFEGRTQVLKARRGLDYLARLLAEPRRELHVLELAGDEVPREHGAPVLDAKAKAAYRERIEALREIAEGGDAARAERARSEIDAIAHELSRALGVGGRDRTTATAADRARAAVTLAIRRAIEAIAAHEPALAGHLEAGIRTGAFCSYRPDPRAELVWDVRA
jgi:hypothetical protein